MAQLLAEGGLLEGDTLDLSAAETERTVMSDDNEDNDVDGESQVEQAGAAESSLPEMTEQQHRDSHDSEATQPAYNSQATTLRLGCIPFLSSPFLKRASRNALQG
jgi:hypothetical protein